MTSRTTTAVPATGDGAFSCPGERVTVDGRAVTFASFGDPDGTPVVALHGTPGSRAFGAFLDAPARERGVRVLAPDRPGVGGSARAPGRSVADGASFVAGFLDALDLDAAGVLGFSGGGPHALACPALVPERVHGTALLASPAPPSADVPQEPMIRATHALARHTTLGLSVACRLQAAVVGRQDADAVLDLFTAAPVADDVVVGDATVPDVLETELELALERGHRALVDDYRALATDWGFDEYAVGPTVHVFHGSEDGNVHPDAGAYLDRVLPDTHLHREPVDHLELVLEHAGDALDAAAGR
ncbi:alpha/beta fold hydrolase [Halorubellus sp. PRR65]|uniref:alpha/beta hydrolase n=1 Tax=Halorubellus sp. PRR65 TaxID=3098148 RepID=UPI002B257E67|nr:alpha/beta fold hydrolase [Halorubellus sp. PRR65]